MSFLSCHWLPRRQTPSPFSQHSSLSEVESTVVPGCRMPPRIRMQASSREDAKMLALTCTGPCQACCPAAGQGSHAESPWHARPAALGSCCCPRNSRDYRHCTPPGRHGPSSGSAHSSWGYPEGRERTLAERQKNLRGKGLHLGCPFHLGSLCILFPSRSLFKGALQCRFGLV